VVERLREICHQEPEELEGVEENIVFSMPRDLRG
jgi:hypothetical protein